MKICGVDTMLLKYREWRICQLLLAVCFAGIFIAPRSLSAQASDLEWREIRGAHVPLPPDEHPRLYVRTRDLDNLRQRMQNPKLEPFRKQLEDMATQSTQYRVEWDALRYLLNRDHALGRQTIKAALDAMQKAEWPKVQDISRAIGRMMVTGAVVYDWCYDLLQPEEQQEFITEFVRMAKLLECGYPPDQQSSVVGHSSERMITRDMISVGIAIYDEFPEIYELSAGRVFREHVPARNWFYPGQTYHQGDSYGLGRFRSDLFPAWIFKRLGAGDIFHSGQQFVPYYWIYIRRPDGQFLRNGDTFLHGAPVGKPWSTQAAGILAASYYGDGYILADHLKAPGMRSTNLLFAFLWSDPDLEPQPVETLPLSRYMGSPFGWMVARTSWDDDAVIAEMKVNEYNFLNHHHLDAGAFQIYHKGILAMDTGLYKGTVFDNNREFHRRNYYRRTIAHNALLVYDPEESFGQWSNDGGQRLPNNWSSPRTLEDMLTKGFETGAAIAHGFGPDRQKPRFTWLKGDITKAYGPKVTEALRSFVFVSTGRRDIPGALIVHDRVTAANAGHKKYWLLHSMEQPDLSGCEITLARTSGKNCGKLISTTILPAADNVELQVVGGPGSQSWVFGKNYHTAPLPTERSAEQGAWRVEVSPRTPAHTDEFLHVLQVMDREEPEKLVISHHVDGDARVVQAGNNTVIFNHTGRRFTGRFDCTIKAAGHILFTDLGAGAWQVRRDGRVIVPAMEVGETSGALSLEGAAGLYSLRR
jgi:heparin/heparan-sulfate lyase